MTAETVELNDLAPREAILAVLHRRTLTARQIVNKLNGHRYEWPGRYPRATYDRVYDLLCRLEGDRKVERLPNPYDNGFVWRVPS